MPENKKEAVNFIEKIINEDLAQGSYDEICTRFPPEPNGFLHIGHAKSILLNYGLAEKYNGKFNLRFDDTNPIKEDEKYVNAIVDDIKWLCPNWDGKILFASDYFDIMFESAVELIKKGLAYVDELNAEQMREYRGTLTEAGKNSPYRDRPIEENLDLFLRMKNDEFEDGRYTLRAKIDMASANINLRDPIIYRILHQTHHNTKDKWVIYPMYDFAHPIEDAYEGVSHSICTLEFEDHRPFYDWTLANLDRFKAKPSKQIEFAKLFLSHTMMGKRYLKQLVDLNYVDGWDDPRMPTISGYRRRGYTQHAFSKFMNDIGVSKSQSQVDIAQFEQVIREDLKIESPRTMAVLNPIKLVITNYPENQSEILDEEINSENETMGIRKITFSREVYIEREDFMIEPAKKYRRLYPGNEVRLRHAYFVKCTGYDLDENGEVTTVYGTYDVETKSGSGFTGRKVKATIHWVDANNCIDATARLYDYLMIDDEYNKQNFLEKFNPESKIVLNNIKLEKNLEAIKVGDRMQMLRHGYFIVDKSSTKDNIVFNRIVPLKSSYKAKK